MSNCDTKIACATVVAEIEELKRLLLRSCQKPSNNQGTGHVESDTQERALIQAKGETER